MTQGQATNVLLSGDSVFLTGAPGAGKTYVLNDFVRRAKKLGKKVAITASTGIAATHIGGTTIHSWSGLGIRDHLSAHDERWLESNQKLIKRYNMVDILVIDEVSMLHGRRLDMINNACKLLRKNKAPFGGLQVVLVGDLFQLPPINRSGETVDFAHNSAAWQELDPKVCYLDEQHRQAGGELLEVLEAMRSGELNESHGEILMSRLNLKPTEEDSVTRLFTHNVDVDSINNQRLAAIENELRNFVMTTGGTKAKREQLMKSVLAPEILELKKGAEVMFVANNFAEGFANGSRGTVIDFDESDWPIIKLAKNNKRITVRPHSWRLEEDGKQRAEVSQLPLRLAWAITIHKSQGMSLDAAEIDLSKSFTPGMGYVALSRIRSLDGLYLSGLNRMALTLHPDIFEFNILLKQASLTLAANTREEVEEIDTAGRKDATEYDPELFEKLRAWRLERAKADKVAPFIIAHNTVLEELARNPPTNRQQLLAAKGFGTKKLENYGDDIMQILSDYAASKS